MRAPAVVPVMPYAMAADDIFPIIEPAFRDRWGPAIQRSLIGSAGSILAVFGALVDPEAASSFLRSAGFRVPKPRSGADLSARFASASTWTAGYLAMSTVVRVFPISANDPPDDGGKSGSDVVLRYSNRRWHPTPETPDELRSPDVDDFFHRARDEYRSLLRDRCILRPSSANT